MVSSDEFNEYDPEFTFGINLKLTISPSFPE